MECQNTKFGFSRKKYKKKKKVGVLDNRFWPPWPVSNHRGKTQSSHSEAMAPLRLKTKLQTILWDQGAKNPGGLEDTKVKV